MMRTSKIFSINVCCCFYVLLIIILYTTPLKANYPSSLIPEKLLVDANCVYRVNNSEVVFDSKANYTHTREVVVTILNSKGKSAGVLAIPYDGATKVKFQKGSVIDARGNTIKKIRKRDLLDRSNVSDFSLYEDSRIVGYIPHVSTYPYTVIYKYEVSYNRGMYYAFNYYPTQTFGRSTQLGTLKISYPNSLDIEFREFNVENSLVKKESEKESEHLQWKFNNILASTSEPLSPPFRKIGPSIMFIPKEFQYDGYYGDNSSWKTFGKWIWSLNEGRDVLPDKRINYLKSLIEDDYSKIEIVKRIYEYLQSHTRYVNVSLGIGGLQPIEASTVDKVGYGDCKALTNYMKAMLKAVDVESKYALVKAGVGKYDFENDFPSSQFNHVILCVPIENDTIWLECTSQHLPFNHLGDFTDNRPVLLIDQDGGHLSKTPQYSMKQNLVNTKSEIFLDHKGDGLGCIKMKHGGIYYVDYLGAMRLAPEDQKKWLYNKFSLPNYTINNYSFKTEFETTPIARVELDVDLRSYASVSNQRFFVPVNLLSAIQHTPPRCRNRKNPFLLNFDRTSNDTLTINLPEGYKVESSVPQTSCETEFGTYELNCSVKGNKIFCVRTMKAYRGLFPPEKYEDYFDFYQKIVRADNQKVIFIANDDKE